MTANKPNNKIALFAAGATLMMTALLAATPVSAMATTDPYAICRNVSDLYGSFSDDDGHLTNCEVLQGVNGDRVNLDWFGNIELQGVIGHHLLQALDGVLGVRELLNVDDNTTELVGNPVAVPLPDTMAMTASGNRNNCFGRAAMGEDTFVDCTIPRTHVKGWGYYYNSNQNGATHVSYSDSVKNNGRYWYETWASGINVVCKESGGKGSYADSLSAGVSRDLSKPFCDTGPAQGFTGSYIDP